MGARSRRRWVLLGLGPYIVLLVLSFLVRSRRDPGLNAAAHGQFIQASAVKGIELTSRPVRMAYDDYPRRDSAEAAPVIVLLHGSPGRKEDFAKLAPLLAERFRVIVPDLPGFGASERALPDYSFRAHAAYVVQLLQQLAVKRAHILGYSMGGGVALNMADLEAVRVSSLVMLSAVGVQEMELTGSYWLNHAAHGVQLIGLWLIREGLPHMGTLDRAALDVSYARNFFDSDQRPLRAVLQRVTAPVLIVHGREDGEVPFEAAKEHARLVPQSELESVDGDHFLPFTQASLVARLITGFVERVERGTAPERNEAEPARIRASAPALASNRPPRLRGIAASVMSMIVSALSFVSWSAGAAAGGVLVARDRLHPWLAWIACVGGGCLVQWLLFLGSRSDRRRLKWASRLFPKRALERVGRALSRSPQVRGLIEQSMTEGSHVTCVAAGFSEASAWKVVLTLVAVNVLWNTAAIGISYLAAVAIFMITPSTLATSLAFNLGVVAIVAMALRLVWRATTFKGRRLCVSSWRRHTRWEFWPPWVFYPPLLVYLTYLMVRYRSITLFTAVNPAIPAGGFVGESKMAILMGLSGASRYVARSQLIPASSSVPDRISDAHQFMRDQGLTFPIVLKPDQGQRGSGVVVVRSASSLEQRLSASSVDTIIQEYIAGREFGVFYYRYPHESVGHLYSITEKKFPSVVGDGRQTVEELILRDDRAVCAARLYCERHLDRLLDVPAVGERISLVELGSHCRGAVFLNGDWVLTPELAERFDAIAHHFQGFFFGRFDVRVSGSDEVFRVGEGFKIIELNGVTSEATHIYHPGTPLATAYRVLMNQWRIAFEIAVENRRRGCLPTRLRALIAATRDYRRISRGHLDPTVPSARAVDSVPGGVGRADLQIANG